MHRLAAAFAVSMLLAACGTEPPQSSDVGAAAADDVAPLPAPSVSGGSVTGMPDTPGPGQPPGAADVAAFDPPTAPTVAGGTQPTPDPAGLARDGLEAASTAAMAATPRAAAADPDAALGVVRAYYNAINAADYAGAHRLWAGDGQASGQSLQQFTGGFSSTAAIAVQMMEPGPVAGGRVEVPVTLETTGRDGSVRHFAGAYVLGGEDGSQLRIVAADLREVQP